MDYPVMLGKETVGKVNLTKEGLYYRIFCRCRITGAGIFRLDAQCGGKRVNLGILVPEGDGFGLERRIPVKHLGDGEMTFQLMPGRDTLNRGTFVPIRAEEPFGYISRLKDSFLDYQDGQKGIRIPDKKL